MKRMQSISHAALPAAFLRRLSRPAGWCVLIAVLDLLGLTLALSSGLSGARHAALSGTPLNAPLPFLALQLVLATVGTRMAGRRAGTIAGGLLAAVCLLSAFSGLADGSFARTLTPAQRTVQMALVAATILAAASAAVQAIWAGRSRPRTAGIVTVTVLAIAATATLSSTGSASAKGSHGYPTVHFAATVSGVQTSEWKMYRDDPPGACSMGYDGAGAERIEFASSRPVRVQAWTIGPGFVVIEGIPDGPASLPVKAHIKRRGHFKEWSNSSATCGTGGDGPAPPPKPQPSDCGTRTSVWTVDIEQLLGASGMTLSEGQPSPLPVYHNCPVGEFGFPNVLETNRYGNQITARVPPAELFNRRQHEIVVVGHGTTHLSAGYEKSYDTIEWTVRLRRVP